MTTLHTFGYPLYDHMPSQTVFQKGVKAFSAGVLLTLLSPISALLPLFVWMVGTAFVDPPGASLGLSPGEQFIYNLKWSAQSTLLFSLPLLAVIIKSFGIAILIVLNAIQYYLTRKLMWSLWATGLVRLLIAGLVYIGVALFIHGIL